MESTIITTMPIIIDESETPSSERQYLSLLLGFDEIVTDIDIPRYLKENDATLRFPVKVRNNAPQLVSSSISALTSRAMQLLLLLEHAAREAVKSGGSAKTACLAWTPDGKGIILRTTQELQNKILPMASCGGKLLSFTRKLYRWGFRQARSKYEKQKIFCHPLFQRDDRRLMVGMKSITAEGTKRALAAKSLMAFQESRLPEQLKAPSPSTKMDRNHLLAHDRPCYGANSVMPIATHSSLRQESMFFPGANTWPHERFGMGCGHPFLSPGVHHPVSTIHEAISGMDSEKRNPSMGGYLLPPPPLPNPNLTIMSLFGPNFFDRPSFGNAYGQYETSEGFFGSGQSAIPSINKHEEEAERMKT
jgi:hypothetical protein